MNFIKNKTQLEKDIDQQNLCVREVSSAKEKVISTIDELKDYIDLNGEKKDNTMKTDANCFDLISGQEGPKIRFDGLGNVYYERIDKSGEVKKTLTGDAKDFIYGRNKFDSKDYVTKKAVKKLIKQKEEEKAKRIQAEEELKMSRNDEENSQTAGTYLARTKRSMVRKKSRRRRKTKKYNIKK